MTELENVDNAYTLRRLGVAARLAWLAGDTDTVREAVLAATASLARVPRIGFWAQEGFANVGDALLQLRAHEQQAGGAVAALDHCWHGFDAALGAHAARFPPGLSLAWRLRGQAALARGEADAARRLLRRAVDAAERQDMRLELARACQALAAAGAGGGLEARAARLWRDMGVRDA
jgi:hypothetical protein